MSTRRMLILMALLSPAVPGCQPRATGPGDAEQAILTQERSALDQWGQGNPLGYLDIDAEDVTYFDDIGASTRIDGVEAMRNYFSRLCRGRSLLTDTR